MKKLLSVFLVLMMVFSMVACDLSSLGGMTSSSQGGTKAETVKVSFKALETGATVIGASVLVVEKGEELNWTEIPSAMLSGCEFVGWAYDVNGDRMLDVADDEFYSDTVLVAIFAPIGEVGGDQSEPKDETGDSDLTESGGDKENDDPIDSSKVDSSVTSDSDAESSEESVDSDVDSSDMADSDDDIDSDVSTDSSIEDSEVDSSVTDITTSGSDTEGEIDKPQQDKVIVIFALRGGELVEGKLEIMIDKGGRVATSMLPVVEKEGFEFKYWAYDRAGADTWYADERFYAETTLYAIWGVKKEDDSVTESSKPSGDDTPDIDVIIDPVVIEYNTGTGYFENSDNYEITIERNTRYTSHPTPVHDNPAMLFTGWYLDDACTTAVSNSMKYTSDVTVLYAGWLRREMCIDGSYNHLFSSWEEDSLPTCEKAGTVARYCFDCDAKEVGIGDPALGHRYGAWTEAFMSREHVCTRLGCGEKEIVEFVDVTLEALGNNPSEQISAKEGAFYNCPLTLLVNGNWDDTAPQVVCPRGNGEAYVIFELKEPMHFDRIYFKGQNVSSINAYVLYEGGDEFMLVGIYGGVDEKEKTPFYDIDSTRRVVEVKLVEENPPVGTSYWQEITFARFEGGADEELPTPEKPTDGKITIEYEVGVGGSFENIDDYEKEVAYGERFREHPTPVNSNPAMLFMGWYTDKACTIPVSNSTKYTSDAVLYARWIERIQCSDGSYNHDYTYWEEDAPPTCVTPGTIARYCTDCGAKEIGVGNSALGHRFSSWEEAFMSKERTCTRLGCGETERVDYKNITVSVLGNNPTEQIYANMEAFYNVPFTNLINNRWDEGFGQFICPRGNGEAYVQFNFKDATALDRIYFKGEGVTSINAYVLYEGEDSFQLLGIYGGVNEKEATPFCDTDSTRKIIAVKFVEENPPQGISRWQEVAFVKLAEE